MPTVSHTTKLAAGKNRDEDSETSGMKSSLAPLLRGHTVANAMKHARKRHLIFFLPFSCQRNRNQNKDHVVFITALRCRCKESRGSAFVRKSGSYRVVGHMKAPHVILVHYCTPRITPPSHRPLPLGSVTLREFCQCLATNPTNVEDGCRWLCWRYRRLLLSCPCFLLSLSLSLSLLSSLSLFILTMSSLF